MANIETKNMWLVYGFMAVSDTPFKTLIEDGKVLGYFDEENDFRCVEDYECMCDTKQEADEYLRQRIAHIKQSAPEIKRILEQVLRDEGEKFNIEDFVPEEVLDGFEFQSQREKMGIVIRRLAKAARFRVIDAGNRSIPIDSILQVEWVGTGESYGSAASITLSNGERITVGGKNDIELDMIAALFGKDRGRSGRWGEGISKE